MYLHMKHLYCTRMTYDTFPTAVLIKDRWINRVIISLHKGNNASVLRFWDVPNSAFFNISKSMFCRWLYQISLDRSNPSYGSSALAVLLWILTFRPKRFLYCKPLPESLKLLTTLFRLLTSFKVSILFCYNACNGGI